MSSVLIVGGSSGLGRALAERYADKGSDVILTSRSTERAEKTAADVGRSVQGLAVDLAAPKEVASCLSEVGPVDHVVIAGIDRDLNTLHDYDVDQAVRLATIKLVGYTEVVHALKGRLTGAGSVLLFGGVARLRPYPGSTTVTAINAGVVGMVRTLSCELAPIRVNSIHPGIVGDSPYWRDKPLDAVIAGTLTGRLATTASVVAACEFLLENESVNGVDLTVDGGFK